MAHLRRIKYINLNFNDLRGGATHFCKLDSHDIAPPAKAKVLPVAVAWQAEVRRDNESDAFSGGGVAQLENVHEEGSVERTHVLAIPKLERCTEHDPAGPVFEAEDLVVNTFRRDLQGIVADGGRTFDGFLDL
ncbi:hypothetical protein RJ640_002688 [Escallonia rubra]|uniref:Uncharacterized protein n=1 Tax=Escallonia rubra TaxID=112253 RepID=A0AA88S8K2_9ASTE|nr:hypothetical protein RJ640_002688 [Escallonia rubra]